VRDSIRALPRCTAFVTFFRTASNT
jgi:hypothetical protein